MASAPRSSRSKRVDSDPLGDLLENMKQNPIPGLFSSPSTDNDNTVVVLDDWWLVRPNVEGGLKKVAVAGHIAKKESEVPFISAQIIKRHDAFILEAADGITVKVEGMINQTNTQNNGFSHEVCQRFNIGFPFFWDKYIDSCVDGTSTHGTSTSQILELFVNGAKEILDRNPEAADSNRINDETLGASPGSSTKEFEPAYEGNPISDDINLKADAVVNLEKEVTTMKQGSDAPRCSRPKSSNKKQTGDKVSNAKDAMPQSGNNSRDKEPPVADIEHHDVVPISTAGKEPEEFATPAKGDTMSDPKLLTSGKRENAVSELKVSDISLSSGKVPNKKDHVTQSTAKITGRGRSHTNMKQHEDGQNATNGNEAEVFATPAKGDTMSNTKVSGMSLRSGKGSSKKEHVPQSTGKITTKGCSHADMQQHEKGLIATDGKDGEESAIPEKGGTVRDTKLPTTGKRKNAVAELKVSDTGKESQSTSKTTRRGRSHTNMEQHEKGLISTDGKDAEESATPEKGDTVRDTKLPTTGKRKNAVAELKVSDTGKETQSTSKTTRRGRSHTNMEQHEKGPISTDGKDAEESATPEKGDTVRDTKLQTAGKRKNVIPESKALETGKGSSNKDRVPQSTSKIIRRGSSHTNMEVHGATISPSPSESNIRRSRSGRAIIPSIDKGSQTVVYDQSGNFTGIVSPISVSKGGTSKPSKKRRF